MGEPFVLDASVALSWCFQDEATAYGRQVLKTSKTTYAVTPALWPFEVANVLILAERRGRITAQLRKEFMSELSQLSIRIERRAIPELWETISSLAQAHRLTAYDASYLDVARRTGLPLATLDGDLKRAAYAIGVSLVVDSE